MKNNIVIIFGSARDDRQGIKAARFIRNKLDERGHLVTLIDAIDYPLPFLNKMHKEYEKGKAPETMEKLHKILNKADSFVILSAEYNHSVPAILKNLLDHFQSEYNFKPSAIVSYSAGIYGGVRVAVHLRAMLAELGMPTMSSTFPITKIQSAFDDDGNALVEKYDKYVIRFLDELEWYTRAFKNERAQGTPY